MKIVVCIKQVPAKDAPLAITDAAWIRETDIGFEMNEPDSYALEEALRLKEKHTRRSHRRVDGPGAREANHQGSAGQGRRPRDPHCRRQSAHARSAGRGEIAGGGIEREKPDLVLTGLQSDDQGFGQTGVLLAELLGLPHATLIMQIEVQDQGLRAEARTRGGMVPVGRASASRRADDPVRHQ